MTLLEPAGGRVPYAGPLPRLSGAVVALDTETRDDGLARDLGPGWVYGMGHICGVSAAWGTEQIYLAMRHPDTECRDPGEVLAWVEAILRDCTVVFHNLSYDMAWLRQEGVRVWPERAHDTHAMAVMLDENWESYSLDACCRRAGVAGKDEAALRDAAAAFGCDPKADLWRMPARHVTAYAEQDARATLDLATVLLPQIDAVEGLRSAYQTEIDLMPATHDMRRRGIRVSQEAAEAAQAELGAQRDAALAEISSRTSVRVSMLDMRSPESLGRLLDAEGVPYPRTPKTGAPSIKKEWMEQHDHWLPIKIRECRQFDDLDKKFVGTYILGHAHRGRIHAEIHQLRDETGGTRTHRLSYSNPPLQQMPSRPDPRRPETVRLIKMLRDIFLAEAGEWWAAPDYNQQEFRLAVHFAAIASIIGAEDAVRYYCDNVDTADFHQMVMKMTGLPRADAKIINFGLMFGMGQDKLIRSLGLSQEEGESMLRTYHERLPWIHGLSDFCSGRAQHRGAVRLIDGARCHFDEWQPRGSRSSYTLRISRAQEEWPGRRLERAGCHKAMNRAVQGSAARQTKRAMAAMHREGLPMLIQLHDEIGLSVSDPRTARRAAEIMVEVVRLRLPVRVDLELGNSWGDAKHSVEDIFGAGA